MAIIINMVMAIIYHYMVYTLWHIMAIYPLYPSVIMEFHPDRVGFTDMDQQWFDGRHMCSYVVTFLRYT